MNPAGRNIAGAGAVFRPHDMLVFTVSANQPRVGRAVERKVRFIQRGGQMAQPGIDQTTARARARTCATCSRLMRGSTSTYSRPSASRFARASSCGAPHGSLMWTPLSASRSRSLLPAGFRPVLIVAGGGVQKHQIGRGSASLVLQEMARNVVIPLGLGFRVAKKCRRTAHGYAPPRAAVSRYGGGGCKTGSPAARGPFASPYRA